MCIKEKKKKAFFQLCRTMSWSFLLCTTIFMQLHLYIHIMHTYLYIYTHTERCVCLYVCAHSVMSNSLRTHRLQQNIHGIVQARINGVGCISFSRGSSSPRDPLHLLHWQLGSLSLCHLRIMCVFVCLAKMFPMSCYLYMHSTII